MVTIPPDDGHGQNPVRDERLGESYPSIFPPRLHCSLPKYKWGLTEQHSSHQRFPNFTTLLTTFAP